MHLRTHPIKITEMELLYRLRETKLGWTVEGNAKFLWFDNWKPAIFWSGTNDPYYFKDREGALSTFIIEIRSKLLFTIKPLTPPKK